MYNMNRKIGIYTIGLLACLLLGGGRTARGVERGTLYRSADTLRCRIYFRLNSSVLDMDFRGNGPRLDSLLSGIRKMQAKACLYRVSLSSSASPEGSSKRNADLSDERGWAVRSWLQDNLAFPDSVFVLSSVGADWQGLERLVGASDMPYRGEVLDILRNTPQWVIRDGKVVDSRRRQLMRLHGGRTWIDMRDRFFPELRNSSVVECEFVPLPGAPGIPVEIEEPMPADTLARIVPGERAEIPQAEETADTVDAPVRKPFYMALKTNLLYDAALVPNAGAEFYLGRGWSAGGSWMYGWWNSDARHRYWRIYGGELEVRRYFGRRAAEKPLTGHHLGLYGQVVTYDFETGGRGIMGGRPGGTLWEKASYGGGIAYGYALPVGKRLNLDFGLGLGYFGGTYYEYIPADGRYVWQSTKKRNWFGPTKAEVSLVWLIGRGNCNEKKGARQ